MKKFWQMGQSLEAFLQWKSLVHLLFGCTEAVSIVSISSLPFFLLTSFLVFPFFLVTSFLVFPWVRNSNARLVFFLMDQKKIGPDLLRFFSFFFFVFVAAHLLICKLLTHSAKIWSLLLGTFRGWWVGY